MIVFSSSCAQSRGTRVLKAFSSFRTGLAQVQVYWAKTNINTPQPRVKLRAVTGTVTDLDIVTGTATNLDAVTGTVTDSDVVAERAQTFTLTTNQLDSITPPKNFRGMDQTA